MNFCVIYADTLEGTSVRNAEFHMSFVSNKKILGTHIEKMLPKKLPKGLTTFVKLLFIFIKINAK